MVRFLAGDAKIFVLAKIPVLKDVRFLAGDTKIFVLAKIPVLKDV